jgi:predicted amidohydrolase
VSVSVAVAQLQDRDRVPTGERLATAGDDVRAAMRRAHDLGARLLLLHEGCLSYPHKLAISSTPGTLAVADWTQADWPALRAELESIAALAGELRLWTVVHAPHRLSDGALPHNSLYVISDEGAIVTRYDKRLLSLTELTYLYTPGTEPIVFDVDGYRFGCAICIEIQFPELFIQYAELDVDCVLFSSSYGADFPRLAAAHASLSALWIAVAMGTPTDAPTSVIVDPYGQTIAACERDVPNIAVATVDRDDPRVHDALWGNRRWRTIARAGELHAQAERPDDPRSTNRMTF